MSLFSSYYFYFLVSASPSCTFPQRWEGTWFLSGHQPIHIKGSSLSFRGKCVQTDGGDKFLMEE